MEGEKDGKNPAHSFPATPLDLKPFTGSSHQQKSSTTKAQCKEKDEPVVKQRYFFKGKLERKRFEKEETTVPMIPLFSCHIKMHNFKTKMADILLGPVGLLKSLLYAMLWH